MPKQRQKLFLVSIAKILVVISSNILAIMSNWLCKMLKLRRYCCHLPMMMKLFLTPSTHTINLFFVAWHCGLNVWPMLLYFLRRNMAIVNHRHIRPLTINLDFNAMVIDEHHHKECGMFAGWTDGFQQLVDGMTCKAWRNPPCQLETCAMLSQFQWLCLIYSNIIHGDLTLSIIKEVSSKRSKSKPSSCISDYGTTLGSLPLIAMTSAITGLELALRPKRLAQNAVSVWEMKWMLLLYPCKTHLVLPLEQRQTRYEVGNPKQELLKFLHQPCATYSKQHMHWREVYERPRVSICSVWLANVVSTDHFSSSNSCLPHHCSPTISGTLNRTVMQASPPEPMVLLATRTSMTVLA